MEKLTDDLLYLLNKHNILLFTLALYQYFFFFFSDEGETIVYRLLLKFFFIYNSFSDRLKIQLAIIVIVLDD